LPIGTENINEKAENRAHQEMINGENVAEYFHTNKHNNGSHMKTKQRTVFA
jgi:hypothetical protein